MSNNQFIILAILFLIFDVELIYIIPWITEVDVFFTWTNTVFVFLCHVILYSLVIELHEGVLIWYKQTLKII
jgi:NADH:ubiquinone oxidoreductase subunit 3 (subunit A)